MATDLSGLNTPVQAGFSASSRNFRKATDRNRIKRLSREAWRLQKHDLYDFLRQQNLQIIIFFIYTGKELPSYPLVSDKFSIILEKLKKELVKVKQ